MILLTTDWHLTDDPADEYRWAVIEHVLHAVIQYKVEHVFVLGDIVDRKDRHSGALVNRLITELGKIAARAPLVILRGNHDTPLHGPAFWEFLSRFNDIHYVTEPTPVQDLLLLPFAARPTEAWRGIKFSNYTALFMHATVTGAVVENGVVMENSRFPILPRAVKIYSGDVHVPQMVGNITYVGAPHPIKFGDQYKCRMLLLDDKYDIALELPLHTPRKLMLDISSVTQLRHVVIEHGDQVKIRFKCPASGIADWGAVESAIHKWAADTGVTIAGTEVLVDSVHATRVADTAQPPEQILREFAAHEGIAEALLDTGLALLKEVR